MALTSRNFVFGFIGAAIVASLVYVTLHSDPVAVDLHRLKRGPMQVTINADGKTRIREVYEVSSPITGTALRAPVRVGDRVIAGQTVVAVVEPLSSSLLDPRSRIQAEAAVREAEAALQVARSRVREAQEDLTHAQREYDRSKALVERGVASQMRLEDSEQMLGMKRAAETAAVSGLEMANSALDRARAALIEPGGAGDDGEASCCMQLTAPVDGRVLEIDVISERPVVAGMRLLSVGQPDDLEIVADLLSTDAVRLDLGDRAIVERWGGDDPLEARISKIEPSAYTKVSALGIEEQRVDVVFDLITPPEQRPALGDGFSVFLRAVEWESDDVLAVPLSAVFRQGSDWAVFVTEGSAARLRRIEIGRRNTSFAEVLSGLEAGETVILHPAEEIAEGTEIEPLVPE